MRSRLVASAEGEAGDEGADDRGQLGQRRPARRRPSVKASASATSVPGRAGDAVDEREQRPARAAARRCRRRRGTATATTMIPATDEHRHRALGDEPDHDGEHDEAHHVVGDRGAEHDAGLGGGERPQVAEHPGGDADARGGQRGADEQRGVEVLADRPPWRRGRGPSARPRRRWRPGARCGRPCRARRGPSRCPTSSRRRITPISPSVRSTSSPWPTSVEHRRADEDAGDDLADDGGDADALGDLGGQPWRRRGRSGCRRRISAMSMRRCQRSVGTRTGRARSSRARPVAARVAAWDQLEVRRAPRWARCPPVEPTSALADLRVRRSMANSNSG